MFIIPTTWKPFPSPNFSKRTKPISAIVLHADASSDGKSTARYLSTPESKVSYHILVDRDGTVYNIVHPDKKAWHAGKSQLDNQTDCNQFTVGVCMSNKNDGEEEYSDAQVAATLEVCKLLCKHYKLSPQDIVSHAAIATPAGRKTDPKGFDIVGFRVKLAGVLR